MDTDLIAGTKATAQPRAAPAWQLIAGFIFGTTFCVVMLVLAFVFPEPSAFQYTICRIVLAIAIAGVAALVPGFLNLDLRESIRAGGALGVFVIVYFFSPAKLVSTPKIGNLTKPPEIEAAAWFSLIDAYQYDKAWERSAEATKQGLPKEGFVQLFRAQREPLGEPKSGRVIYSLIPSQTLPDGRQGNFRIIGFRTRFSNAEADLIEWLTLTEENRSWRVMAHVIGPVGFDTTSTKK